MIRRIQGISEEVTRLQGTDINPRAKRLCYFLKREISKRIHKISNKIHKITTPGKSAGKGDPKGNKFDFLRNDDEFDYQINQSEDRAANKFETEMRRMENQEMQRLTESIEAVSKLFVSMSSLVFEQGTIIDRIDMNISMAVERVEQGNLQLIRAIEHQNNGLADYLIRILGFIVVALAALLFLKYS